MDVVFVNYVVTHVVLATVLVEVVMVACFCVVLIVVALVVAKEADSFERERSLMLKFKRSRQYRMGGLVVGLVLAEKPTVSNGSKIDHFQKSLFRQSRKGGLVVGRLSDLDLLTLRRREHQNESKCKNYLSKMTRPRYSLLKREIYTTYSYSRTR